MIGRRRPIVDRDRRGDAPALPRQTPRHPREGMTMARRRTHRRTAVPSYKTDLSGVLADPTRSYLEIRS